MKKVAALSLKALVVLMGGAASAHAVGMVLQPVDQNIDSEHKELSRFFDDLSKSPTRDMSLREAAASMAASAPRGKVGGYSFSQAADSPVKANATLDAMSVLAQVAAQSIGTASQGQMAQNLQGYGDQLAGSKNTTLAQAGGLMQQEAAAVNLGDETGAQSYASSISGLPQMSTSGYNATASDNTYAGAMQQIGQQALASAASTFSQAAISALGSWLSAKYGGGSSTGSSTGGFWTSMFSNLGGSLAGGAVKGTNSPSTLAGQTGGMAGQAGGNLGSSAGSAAFGSQQGSGGALGAPLQVNSGGANIGLQTGAGTAAGSALPGAGH